MSKKRWERGGDEAHAPREMGGLADTNCGIILADIVATRSWTAVTAIILLMGVFVRAAVGLGGYSGTTSPSPCELDRWGNGRPRETAHVWRL